MGKGWAGLLIAGPGSCQQLPLPSTRPSPPQAEQVLIVLLSGPVALEGPAGSADGRQHGLGSRGQ